MEGEAPTLDTQFDDAMQLGVITHVRGGYEKSIVERLVALSKAKDRVARGRAYRDISAAYDRLGGDLNFDLAAIYAEKAYLEHSAVVEDLSQDLEEVDSEDEYNEAIDTTEKFIAMRELSVTAMYLAISESRKGKNENALAHIQEAWSISSVLLILNNRYHQYDINLIGRVVALESIFGDKPVPMMLRRLGMKAVKLALKSEEPEQVLGANQHLDAWEVKSAKEKAIARAIAANMILYLESLPTFGHTRLISDFILKKAVL